MTLVIWMVGLMVYLLALLATIFAKGLTKEERHEIFSSVFAKEEAK